MLSITDTQKKIISPYIDKLDEYIETENIGDLLLELDDAIVMNILDNENEPNEPDEIGIKLQRIYDQIYNQN